MPENTTSPPEINTQIAHVGVKPPPFWKTNPTLWFVRLEAQFALSKISCETTKFYHVVAAIDADILSSVSDIIVNPPTTNPYESLKKRLIESHSASEESRIRTLLQGMELGDQRPSQLLTRMRSLAGEAVGEALLKSLWLNRLPPTTQSVLAALSDDLPQLAAVADKITDLVMPAQVNTVANRQTTSVSQLEQQISALTKQVSELSTMVQRRERSRGSSPHGSRHRSKSQRRYRSYKDLADNICFYHTNFGIKAKKCSPPCSFNIAEN